MDIEFLYRRELQLKDGLHSIDVPNYRDPAYDVQVEAFTKRYIALFTAGMRRNNPDYTRIHNLAVDVATEIITRYVYELAGQPVPKKEDKAHG